MQSCLGCSRDTRSLSQISLLAQRGKSISMKKARLDFLQTCSFILFKLIRRCRLIERMPQKNNPVHPQFSSGQLR